MDLQLTENEARVLREVLTTHLGDLSAEIAATDNPAFRRELRARRDLLYRVNSGLVTQLQQLA
jgi:hypothetical protein